MKKFLRRYNPNSDQNVALKKAWGASVGHNRLYSVGCPIGSDGRKEIFDAWSYKVKKLVFKRMTSPEYECAFVSLKDEMNLEFKKYLSDEGFRISHAQKGLSVYMKHLWCMGIISEPPQCPVDKTILTEIATGEEYKTFGNIRWTKINDITCHRSIMSVIQKISGEKSIARWELDNFLPNGAGSGLCE